VLPTDSERRSRLSLFCAYQQAPSDPHTYLVISSEEALVILHIRIDGLIEVLSNAAGEARRAIDRSLIEATSLRSEEDFEVVSEGWRRDGRAPYAFAALAVHEWKQRQEGRSLARQKREDEARNRERKMQELEGWLTEFGLESLAPQFHAEGIELDTLQYLQEEDLVRIGVSRLGERRKLMAAKQTQAQYKALTEKLEGLERQRDTLLLGQAQSQAQTAKAVKDLAIALDQMATINERLQQEQQRGEQLQQLLNKQKAIAKSEAERADAAEAQAKAYAEDAVLLQEQLQKITELQRNSIREHREKLVRRVDEMTSSIKAGNAGSRLRSRRSSVLASSVVGSRRHSFSGFDGSKASMAAVAFASTSQPACG